MRLGVTAALLDGALVPGDVEVDGDRILAVGLAVGPGAPPRTAVPGLVDVQVNGGVGVDLLEADAAGVHEVARALARAGVLAWLPTFVTAPEERTRAALAVLAEACATLPPDAARPLGVHLEGPVLAPGRLGVHDPRWRRDPSPTGLEALLDPAVRMVTLAPELSGADAAVRHLVARGIAVSLGHSDATAAEARRAVDAGAATRGSSASPSTTRGCRSRSSSTGTTSRPRSSASSSPRPAAGSCWSRTPWPSPGPTGPVGSAVSPCPSPAASPAAGTGRSPARS
jgi:N-acetylglucosamine-6-phosphate deacetylase